MARVSVPNINIERDVIDLLGESVRANIKTLVKKIFTPKAQRFLGSRLRVTVHDTDKGAVLLLRFFYDSYLEIESRMTSTGQVELVYRKLSVKDYVAAIEDQGWDVDEIHKTVEGLEAVEDMLDLPVKIATPQVALQFTRSGLPFIISIIDKALQLA